MAIQMGLGRLGDADIIHKRKFRWTFQIQRPQGGDVPSSFVKMAARPNVSIEETEINHLNGKTYIPGKGTWETITITYYDVATADNLPLWNWLADVFNFLNPDTMTQNSKRSCYTGTGVCTLYDGCGNPLEKWRLGDCWPQAINFGELDYSSSEEATIEVTLRYGKVQYKSLCPNAQPAATCCPC